MFADLSWTHIFLLIVVALVVVGPKDLPRLLGEVGRWTKKARSMADQLRASFDDIANQGELDELRKEVEALKAVHPFEGASSVSNQSLQLAGSKSPAARMNDDPTGAAPAAAGRRELVAAIDP